jgi:hypothetical protein
VKVVGAVADIRTNDILIEFLHDCLWSGYCTEWRNSCHTNTGQRLKMLVSPVNFQFLPCHVLQNLIQDNSVNTSNCEANINNIYKLPSFSYLQLCLRYKGKSGDECT